MKNEEKYEKERKNEERMNNEEKERKKKRVCQIKITHNSSSNKTQKDKEPIALTLYLKSSNYIWMIL